MLSKKYTGLNDFPSEATYKVAELIFKYPHTIFHLRRIARETDFSTTAITDAIKILESKKILKIEKTAITKNIRANLESLEYYSYKRIFNLFVLKKWSIIEALQKSILDTPKVIVLFGSFAKGEDIENSDVDILVIAQDKRTAKQKGIDDAWFLPFKEFTGRKINLHVLPNLDKSSTEFKNTIANGIVLYGYLKVL